MWRRSASKPKKHKPLDPKIQTAESWQRQVFKETGKKVRLLPGHPPGEIV
jgi:hypothetical protein